MASTILGACATQHNAARPTEQEPAPAQALIVAPFAITVPGTTASLVMRVVPADGPTSRSFTIATTEITWDMYDAFVFALDKSEDERDPPDAWTRPSKPYILMDRGFGHSGYPAISVSFRGATEFCRWLSARTGRAFRLPTEGEWERACRLGAPETVDVSHLERHAWYAGNSEAENRLTTHPVATQAADQLGLHDMLGNAAEWTLGSAGTGVARGGSFRDSAEFVSPSARRPDDRSLNRTDPQVPKSVWWLADGGFIGFRVVCDGEVARATSADAPR